MTKKGKPLSGARVDLNGHGAKDERKGNAKNGVHRSRQLGSAARKSSVMVTNWSKESESRTAELEENLRIKMGERKENYTSRDWTSLREQFRLPLLYPGRYVAFRDHHVGEGAARRLESREIVYVGDSMREVQEYVGTLPDAELQGVFIQDVPRMKSRKHGRA